MVLVCRSCNSKYGKDIDNLAQKHLQGRQFLHGIEGASYGTTLKFPWYYNEVKLKSEWKNGILTTNTPKGFKPKVKTEILQKFDEGETFTVNMTGDIPKHTFLRRSLLRAAFLKCFTVWGYDFAMSDIGRKIMSVIDGNEDHPSESMGVYFQNKSHIPKNGISHASA